MSHLWKHVVNVSLDMFQRIFMKCCWSGAYLTPRGAGALKWDNLAQCFVYQCRTRPTDPGAASLSRALCLSLRQSHSPQITILEPEWLHQWRAGICQGGVAQHMLWNCATPLVCLISRACEENGARILWTRGFLFKKQEMGVEALGRRHDWMRIQIVWEWENGGLEFGVCFTKSGHPWKCLLGFGVQPPPPSISLPSFSCSLPVFLGRSPAENREALNKRGERLFCCTLIVRVVSASLFSCLTLACRWEYMLKWLSGVWWATLLTYNQSSKIKLAWILTKMCL